MPVLSPFYTNGIQALWGGCLSARLTNSQQERAAPEGQQETSFHILVHPLAMY